MFTDPEAADGVDAVLITHEHPDHYLPEHARPRLDAPVFTIDGGRGEDPRRRSRRQRAGHRGRAGRVLRPGHPGASRSASCMRSSIPTSRASTTPATSSTSAARRSTTRATHWPSPSNASTRSASRSALPGCALRRGSTSPSASVPRATWRSTTASTPRRGCGSSTDIRPAPARDVRLPPPPRRRRPRLSRAARHRKPPRESADVSRRPASRAPAPASPATRPARPPGRSRRRCRSRRRAARVLPATPAERRAMCYSPSLVVFIHRPVRRSGARRLLLDFRDQGHASTVRAYRSATAVGMGADEVVSSNDEPCSHRGRPRRRRRRGG